MNKMKYWNFIFFVLALKEIYLVESAKPIDIVTMKITGKIKPNRNIWLLIPDKEPIISRRLKREVEIEDANEDDAAAVDNKPTPPLAPAPAPGPVPAPTSVRTTVVPSIEHGNLLFLKSFWPVIKKVFGFDSLIL